MRMFVPVLAVLLAGCSSGIGPMRLKPGSNVVLPAHISVKDILLKEAACAALGADSVSKSGSPAAIGCKTLGPVTPPHPPR